MRLHFSVPVLAAALLVAGSVEAQTIVWLDWTAYPIPGSGTVVSHPVLGDVRVTTDFEPQATFGGAAGSLGSLSWSTFEYVNYDGSSTGTSSPIQATMTFTFLDGPIDLATTRIFFSSNGLAAASSYLVDGAPVFLGAIGSAEGPGTYTPIGQQLRIQGAGFNHDPDLIELQSDPLATITVDVDQVMGDGTGFSIGAASVAPAVSSLSGRGRALLVVLLAGGACFSLRRRR